MQAASPDLTAPGAPLPDSFAALEARFGPRYRWLLLMAVTVGLIAAIMSSTVVNVAIPQMSLHFGLNQEQAQWVSSGFMVAMTATMLATPWLVARYGYRRVYTASMLLLIAGGLAGGLADQFPVLLLSRVVEGAATGVVQPIPAIIILRAFAKSEQGKASGLFGMVVVLAPAVGPTIGGVLVDAFGWRSIFFMVVPFCLVGLALAWRLVPAGRQAEDDGHAALDWPGLLLGMGATLCLLNGLLEVRAGSRWLAGGLLAAAVVLAIAFVRWQALLAGRGRRPLMNLAIFRRRTFALGSVVAFVYGACLFGSTYLLPVYMQMALSLPASQVGAVLLPSELVLGVGMVLAGRLSDRVGIRPLLLAGMVLLAASFLLMPAVPPAIPLPLLIAWTLLGRLGLGLILPSLNVGAVRSLPPAQLSQGATAINFIRMLGGAAGISLCAILLEWRLAVHGGSLGQGTAALARLTAFNESFALLALLCGVGLLAAWCMRDSLPAEGPTGR